MCAMRHKSEEIISKLRETAVLLAEGISVGEVVRRQGVTQMAHYSWRKEHSRVLILTTSMDHLKGVLHDYPVEVRRQGFSACLIDLASNPV